MYDSREDLPLEVATTAGWLGWLCGLVWSSYTRGLVESHIIVTFGGDMTEPLTLSMVLKRRMLDGVIERWTCDIANNIHNHNQIGTSRAWLVDHFGKTICVKGGSAILTICTNNCRTTRSQLDAHKQRLHKQLPVGSRISGRSVWVDSYYR